MARPHLLSPAALLRTSEVDHADWNFRPVLGLLQRQRFRLATALLGERRFERLLEIGYGSGVFMPELARRCDALHGIDAHERSDGVVRVLAAHGVAASLRRGSAEKLPHPDGHFDAVVAISAFEYVPDVAAACGELQRVLRPGGRFVVVTPGSSPLLDLALKLTTGESASQYDDRRQRLLPALRSHFAVDAELRFPPVVGRIVPLYRALRLTTRGAADVGLAQG